MAATDGTEILLLAGTKLGQPGSVITLSSQAAQVEIAAGRAIDVDPFENKAQTPSSAATPGVAGQIVYDNGFLYICVVTGIAGKATWKKVALSAA